MLQPINGTALTQADVDEFLFPRSSEQVPRLTQLYYAVGLSPGFRRGIRRRLKRYGVTIHPAE